MHVKIRMESERGPNWIKTYVCRQKLRIKCTKSLINQTECSNSYIFTVISRSKFELGTYFKLTTLYLPTNRKSNEWCYEKKKEGRLKSC